MRLIVMSSTTTSTHLIRPGPAASRRVGSVLITSGLPEEGPRRRQVISDLVQWSYLFSPLSAPDRAPYLKKNEEEKEPDPNFFGFNLDLSGSARLFGGELNLIKTMAEGLRTFGFEAQIAIAPSLGAAWAVSRFGRRRLSIVSDEFLKTAVSRLPAAALRLSPLALQILNEVNVLSCAELMVLPRPALLSRFGGEAVIRLDQALSRYEEPIESVKLKPRFQLEHKFDEPVNSIEVLQWAAGELLHELIRRVRERHKRIACIEIVLGAVPQMRLRRSIPLSSSSLDFNHLEKLLGHAFEKFAHELSAYEAGVEELVLSAPDLDPASAEQRSALPEIGSGVPERLGELLDRLSEKLGQDNIGYLEPRESYIPERSFDFVPAHLRRKKHSRGEMARVLTAGRPSILFPHPQPVKAMSVMPDGPPFMIQWKGKRYHVVAGVGPERISPEWWGKDEELTRERDYYKVQLPDGTWLWVYRSTVEVFGEEPRWFLHGIWA